MVGRGEEFLVECEKCKLWIRSGDSLGLDREKVN